MARRKLPPLIDTKVKFCTYLKSLYPKTDNHLKPRNFKHMNINLQIPLMLAFGIPLCIKTAATPRPLRTKNLFLMKNEETEKAKSAPAQQVTPENLPTAPSTSSEVMATTPANSTSVATSTAAPAAEPTTTTAPTESVPVTLLTTSDAQFSVPTPEIATPVAGTNTDLVTYGSPETQVPGVTEQPTATDQAPATEPTPAQETPAVEPNPVIESTEPEISAKEATDLQTMETMNAAQPDQANEETHESNDEWNEEPETPCTLDHTTREEREIIIINNTGVPVTVYGTRCNQDDKEIATGVGPLAQIVVTGDVEQLYVKEEDDTQSPCHINVNYNNLSNTFPDDHHTLIDVDALSTIVTIQRVVGLDETESKIVLQSTSPQVPYGALIYNTTNTEQTLKATFPHEASWFSTPKVYFKIPPLSAHMITFPLVNKNRDYSVVNLGLVTSKMPIVINPPHEGNPQQKIFCIFTLDDGDILTDVTEQFA